MLLSTVSPVMPVAAWSFTSAASVAPVRAPARATDSSAPFWLKPMPNSMAPNVSNINSGKMMTASTSAAPRSLRRRRARRDPAPLGVAHDPIEGGRRDSLVVRGFGVAQRRQELVDTPAGERRDRERGRVRQEAELVDHLVAHRGALLGVEKVPLVQHDHDGGTGGV